MEQIKTLETGNAGLKKLFLFPISFPISFPVCRDPFPSIML
jgi:hypothetical protein